jgi:glycosyltransferase involved in cell wall biosynthesis
MTIKLSICIATFRRGNFIGETLDSILWQLKPGVEVVVVDGASPDNTFDVMKSYVERHPEIRYFRESVNSGVDADFDKAVGYANGQYCWLMTDDDLLKPGAINKILTFLDGNEELIIINSEIRNVDMTEVFEARSLKLDLDKIYREKDQETFFSDIGAYLSFIGCVVIRKDFWCSRNRSSYYGSLFIHVGVIFQSSPVKNVAVISEPLIVIRYGNAMWTSRSFEVWMFKWPQLIWSFPSFSDNAKRKICRREPWRSSKALFHNRALGALTLSEFNAFWPIQVGVFERAKGFIFSIVPASFANAVMTLYFSWQLIPNKMAIHDLLFSRNSTALSRFFARAFDSRS